VSKVTNVILVTSCLDDYREGDDEDGRPCPPGVAQLKAWCEDEANGCSPGLTWPKHASAVAAGPKNLECGMWVWAANHFDAARFLKVVARCPWEDPEAVQVFIKGQDDEQFTVCNLGADRMWAIIGRDFGPEDLAYIIDAEAE
jgi:hypothetical protein